MAFYSGHNSESQGFSPKSEDDAIKKEVFKVPVIEEDLWILFLDCQKPVKVNLNDAIQLSNSSEVVASSHVHTINLHNYSTPIKCRKTLRHFIKQIKNIIREYYPNINLNSYSFLAGIKCSNSEATVRIVELKHNQLQSWIQRHQLKLKKYSISTEDLPTGTNVFKKFWKESSRKITNGISFYKRKRCLSQSTVEESKKEDDLRNSKENLLYNCLEFTKEQISGTEYPSPIKTCDHPEETLLFKSRMSKANTDTSRLLLEIKEIKSSIEDAEENISQSLLKFLKDEQYKELRESMDEKIRDMTAIKSKTESLALNVINEQLRRTTEELSASQATVFALVQKNRDLEYERVQKSEEQGKTSQDRDEELKEGFIEERETVHTLQSELAISEREATNLSHQIYEQAQTINKYKASQRKLLAEKSMEQTLLKKEIYFKDKIILDGTEEVEFLIQDLEMVAETFFQFYPELSITSLNFPKIDDDLLVEMIKAARHWIGDFNDFLKHIFDQLKTNIIKMRKYEKICGDGDNFKKNELKEEQVKPSKYVLENVERTIEEKEKEEFEHNDNFLNYLSSENLYNQWMDGKAHGGVEVKRELKMHWHMKELEASKVTIKELRKELEEVVEKKNELERGLCRVKRENEMLESQKKDLLIEIYSVQEVLNQVSLESMTVEIGKQNTIASNLEKNKESNVINDWDMERIREVVNVQGHVFVAELEEKSKLCLEKMKTEGEDLRNELERIKTEGAIKVGELTDLVRRKSKKCCSLSKELSEMCVKVDALEGALKEAEKKHSEDAKTISQLILSEEELIQARMKLKEFEQHLETMDRDFKRHSNKMNKAFEEEVKQKCELDGKLESYIKMIEELRVKLLIMESELSVALARASLAEQKLEETSRLSEIKEAQLKENLKNTESKVRGLEEEIVTYKSPIENFDVLKSKCSELEEKLFQLESEHEAIISQLHIKDKMLNEATISLERAFLDLEESKNKLDEKDKSIASLKMQVVEEKEKLEKELNEATKDKTETEKQLTEILIQKENLEVEHEKVVNNLIKAFKMVSEGKALVERLEAQVNEQEVKLSKLQVEKNELEMKLAEAREIIEEGKYSSNSTLINKKELIRKISESMSKNIYEKVLKELKKKFSLHEGKFKKEKAELEMMLLFKQKLLDEKDLFIKSLQERISLFNEDMKQTKEQVLNLKQVQNNLKDDMLAMDMPKKDISINMKEMGWKEEMGEHLWPEKPTRIKSEKKGNIRNEEPMRGVRS